LTPISANQVEGVCLWDIRKPRQKVLEYGAALSDKNRGAMSAVFNSDGTRIMALGRRKPVILYAIDSPIRLGDFDHPGSTFSTVFRYFLCPTFPKRSLIKYAC
jgi:hypothetical protein